MKKKVLSLPQSCPLCAKKNFTILYHSTLVSKDFDSKVIKADLKNTLDNYKKHTRIVKCRSCDLVYTNPMEDFSKLMNGYKDVVDETYIETEKFRKILLQQHMEQIEKFKKKGKILDIGCFAGYFLEIAKEKKWKTFGIEPSIWAKKIAEKRKIKIIGDNIQKVHLQDNFYDVITMWDVIEHLPNGKEVLEKCYKGLKQGGIIALGTPNIESIVAKFLGSNNPYLVRMHLVFFSPKTLGKMLESVGFKTIKVYSYGRTFPISYVVDRVKINNSLFRLGKNLINAVPFIANYPIHVNIGDSFVVIAQKT